MADLEENRQGEVHTQKSQNDDQRPSIETVPFQLKNNNFIDKRNGLKTSTVPSFLNDPILQKAVDEYETLTSEEKRIFNLALDKKIRKSQRNKKGTARPVNLTIALHSNDPNHYDFQAYLESVTKTLEQEGLWKEELSETLESDLFPQSAEKEVDLDHNFGPKLLTSIYTKKNQGVVHTEVDPNEQGLDWKESSEAIQFDSPKLAENVSHNLFRRSPWYLKEKIARLMVEGSFFDQNPDLEKLFPCAYFYSKSIFDRSLFIKVKYEAFADTSMQKNFRTYSFHRYKEDQKILADIIDEILKSWFLKNSSVKSALKEYGKTVGLTEKQMARALKNIWPTFLETKKKLTVKQLLALEAVYMQIPPMTFAEAANAENISRDSFQDRINGAIKKFKEALPELAFLDTTSEKKISTACDLLYNGFYRKSVAKEVARLICIDPATNERIEVEPRGGVPLPTKQFANAIMVRAWAIASTPVPDIMETEYFLGLFPEGLMNRKKS